jgi:alanine-glyoxylate transaminase/serine-glyoxylate transaminase/serine-pyruvate transaminase
MDKTYTQPPHRVLLGPGPSEIPPEVLRALSIPLLGHLDPVFLKIMDETQDLLKEVSQTKNELTFAMPGTGMAGMEACLINVLEPGDKYVVGIHGFFGTRLADIGRRAGADVVEVNGEWGKPLDADTMRETIEREKPQVVAFVHAETSTGVLQAPEPIVRAAHDVGAVVVMDAVTSLGGMPVKLDAWEVDACYSGAQKCIGAPPGFSPISYSPRAVEKLDKRAKPVQSFYLDLSVLRKYWGTERAYHHTAPISNAYALREALRLVVEEGLEARWDRHHHHQKALVAGLEAMGLELLVADPDHRLWGLTTVRIPTGVDDAAVRKQLLNRNNIEIGGGLGALKGKVWRIGLMGYSSTANNVLLVLAALEDAVRAQGFKPKPGAIETAQQQL